MESFETSKSNKDIKISKLNITEIKIDEKPIGTVEETMRSGGARACSPSHAG